MQERPAARQQDSKQVELSVAVALRCWYKQEACWAMQLARQKVITHRTGHVGYQLHQGSKLLPGVPAGTPTKLRKSLTALGPCLRSPMAWTRPVCGSGS